MYKKLILSVIYSTLLMLIFAPANAQGLQTIKIPSLQTITKDNIQNLQLLGTLENFQDVFGVHVTDFALSPNHQWLAANLHGGVLIYDLINNNIRILEQTVQEDAGGFSNDSSLYLLPIELGTKIYDTSSWDVIATLPDDFAVGDVLFSPDNRFIATTHARMIPGYIGEDLNGIYIFDTTTWTLHNRLPLDIYLSGVSFAFQMRGDKSFIISINQQSEAHLWDYETVFDYTDPNLPQKSDLIASLQRLTYPDPDGIAYQWVGFGNEAGDYALWLTAPDGSALFGKSDGSYDSVTAGESGENHDENGIPTTYNDYTRLERRDTLFLLQLSDNGEISFGSPNGNVVIVSRSEANQTMPMYTYNSEADALINNQDGGVYPAQESGTVGEFVNDDSSYISAFKYRLDGFPIPEILPIQDDLIFSRHVSEDGNYAITLLGDGIIGLYDLMSNTPVFVFEGLPLISFGYQFNFNTTPNQEIAFINYIDEEQNLVSQLEAWDITTGTLLRDLPTDTLGRAMHISQDGQLLIIGGGFQKDRLEFWGVPQS